MDKPEMRRRQVSRQRFFETIRARKEGIVSRMQKCN
jgi:hypothetical protein